MRSTADTESPPPRLRPQPRRAVPGRRSCRKCPAFRRSGASNPRSGRVRGPAEGGTARARDTPSCRAPSGADGGGLDRLANGGPMITMLENARRGVLACTGMLLALGACGSDTSTPTTPSTPTTTTTTQPAAALVVQGGTFIPARQVFFVDVTTTKAGRVDVT